MSANIFKFTQSGADSAQTITATPAEIDVLADVTAGTATASKALVIDANKAISTITTGTITNLTTTALTLGATAVTASGTEINTLTSVTPGTATASKAVVLGASKEISTITTATITNLTTSALTIGATALGSTATEIDTRCDDSAMSESIVAAGALSTSVALSELAVAGGGAVTLAVPTKPAMIKILHMTTYGGNVTLALTNIVGTTLGTETTCTFNSVGDRLVLVSDSISGKWIILKEAGVVMT